MPFFGLQRSPQRSDVTPKAGQPGPSKRPLLNLFDSNPDELETDGQDEKESLKDALAKMEQNLGNMIRKNNEIVITLREEVEKDRQERRNWEIKWEKKWSCLNERLEVVEEKLKVIENESKAKLNSKQVEELGRQMREEAMSFVKSREKKEAVGEKALKQEVEILTKRCEESEKKDRKNNIIISGLEEESKSKEWNVAQVQKWIERELKVKVDVQSVWRVGKKGTGKSMLGFKCAEWKQKLELMRMKSQLGSKRVFLNDDLTFKEREIQKRIRQKAEEKKKEDPNARIKVGYRKLCVGNEQFLWSDRENCLFRKE